MKIISIITLIILYGFSLKSQDNLFRYHTVNSEGKITETTRTPNSSIQFNYGSLINNEIIYICAYSDSTESKKYTNGIYVSIPNYINPENVNLKLTFTNGEVKEYELITVNKRGFLFYTLEDFSRYSTILNYGVKKIELTGIDSYILDIRQDYFIQFFRTIK